MWHAMPETNTHSKRMEDIGSRVTASERLAVRVPGRSGVRAFGRSGARATGFFLCRSSIFVILCLLVRSFLQDPIGHVLDGQR